MLGTIGEVLINASFLSVVLAAVAYYRCSSGGGDRWFRRANWLFAAHGFFLLAASGILLHLILTHQFNYYYVFKYTSSDLQLRYLVSAFWGGQEGSFMLWILFSFLMGAGLMKWTRKSYRGPVLFFLALTQVFLMSMVAGIPIGDWTMGASPFRTLAEAMPNAPFIQTNPDFVPSDGQGLNDLLKSPWMMIHPPILFLGFSMMTIPYCFAMAALWKRRYNEWVGPALPWTLGANVALLTAIFLGGYWAYVTLSFGGYWAWDPVENASLVPWLLGTAGIHTMIIQRKSSTSQKASIIFALLAYVAIVYETFLTRSGILSDASVHSFVDLGLYNQLVAFMAVVTFIGLGMFFYRYRDLPSQDRESKILSREFMTFAGAMVLFLLGLVIILGTSSPIIGRLFTVSPTPPEISFYNDWTMPLAIIAAILTVFGQFLFWSRQTAESLADELTWPVAATCVLTLASIMLGNVRDIYYMVYILAGWFALVGNGVIMYRLLRQNSKLIGGALSHTGFALLMLGILASSAYNEHLLDPTMAGFNAAVDQGTAVGADGLPATQKRNFFQLRLNESKVVNDKYRVTYEGYTLRGQTRTGQQEYRIKFEPADGEGRQFYLTPEVYPMLSSSSGANIQWSVDPDVRTGLLSDIYLYVSGSSYVERKNRQAEEQQRRMSQGSGAAGGTGGLAGNMADSQQDTPADTTEADSMQTQTLSLSRGSTVTVGSFEIAFNNYRQVPEGELDLPDSTMIAVRAQLDVTDRATNSTASLQPLFAIYNKDGQSWSYAPPVTIPGTGDVSIQFSNVKPESGEIELTIRGLDETYQEEWVLLVAEEKPLISVVWLGTFVLMAGFSVSIMRHWLREREKS
ncbi:MAG: cytochrome c biogenesis protein CcsA [Balneolaceae bacterium]|nr:cytochrome c biogenesis protein CcsA [Balneolaceae bacterium]